MPLPGFSSDEVSAAESPDGSVQAGCYSVFSHSLHFSVSGGLRVIDLHVGRDTPANRHRYLEPPHRFGPAHHAYPQSTPKAMPPETPRATIPQLVSVYWSPGTAEMGV